MKRDETRRWISHAATCQVRHDQAGVRKARRKIGGALTSRKFYQLLNDEVERLKAKPAETAEVIA